MTKKVAKFNNT